MRVSWFGKLLYFIDFYDRIPVAAASEHHHAGDMPVWVVSKTGPDARLLIRRRIWPALWHKFKSWY
jgi:hypothetical protein